MKKYIVLVLIALLMGALFVGVSAAPKAEHVYLYEKDAEWVIVDGGAWGKMQYKVEGSEFSFVFNGKGLVADEDYTLIVYTPDEWPAEGLFVLGSDTASNNGNVHIAGLVFTDTLIDVKIWLVLSDDVEDADPAKMIGWNPASYLFENDLITFTQD